MSVTQRISGISGVAGGGGSGAAGAAGRWRRGLRRAAGLLGGAAWLVAGLGVGGCAFENHREDMARLAGSGDYRAAAATLDSPEVQRMYGENSRLVWLLDRGAIALALGKPEEAIDLLERAEAIMDIEKGNNAGDTLLQWTVNDASAKYYGEPYEDLYTNVLKLAAQLQRGVVQGGATVEARRAASKANLLRDRYLRGQRELEGKARSQFGGRLDTTGPFAGRTTGGQFVESPLGAFLTAVTFNKTGDAENQAVAARRLAEIIAAQGPLIGPVRAEDFAGLERQAPEASNLLVVAFSGTAPTKHPERFGPIPIYTYPVYFEVPVLRGGRSIVTGARLVAEPVVAGTGGEGGRAVGEAFTVDMPLVEDMASVARANHEAALPQIYARAIIRSSLKAAASAAATEAVRRSSSDRNQGAVEVLGVLIGMAVVGLTERADLRCWTFLPGQAHVGLAKLPAGKWRVRVEYLAGGSVVHASEAQEVSVSEDPAALATVLSRFAR